MFFLPLVPLQYNWTAIKTFDILFAAVCAQGGAANAYKAGRTDGRTQRDAKS